MPRPKKPLGQTKKHYTKSEQLDKEMAEKLIVVGNEDLLRPPSWLVDKVAVTEFQRIVSEQVKIEIIGNLDLNNIACYCNSYSLYRKATKELKKQPLTMKRTLLDGGDVYTENPLIKIQKNYADEMRKFGAKCGLDIDSRLKAGTYKTSKIEEDVLQEFGDI